MHWTDEGIVLSARPHGESAGVVVLLSRDHGRHAGLLHGGQGRKGRGLLEPGTRVAAEWRARLAEHLGSFTLELIESHAAGLLDDAARPLLRREECRHEKLPADQDHEDHADGDDEVALVFAEHASLAPGSARDAPSG